MLNKRYIKSIKRDIFVLISFPVFLFQFLFCYILERKVKKSFKHDIIVFISFLILFVSISFLVNIGKEMSLLGFRRSLLYFVLLPYIKRLKRLYLVCFPLYVVILLCHEVCKSENTSF